MDDAARIAELQARLDALEARLAPAPAAVSKSPAPPSKVSRPITASADSDREPTRFDRRGFLRRAAVVGGVAAGGGALALAGASPAEAGTGGSMIIGSVNSPSNATDAPTQLQDPSSSDLSPLLLRVNNWTSYTIVPPQSRIALAATVSGVDSTSNPRYGLWAASDGAGTGAYGQSASGAGVTGVSGGATAPGLGGPVGVYGASGGDGTVGVLGYVSGGTLATGVSGSSVQGTGVAADSSGAKPALAAEAFGTGNAVTATSTSATGVLGRSGGVTELPPDGPVGVYGAATGDGSVGVSGFAQIGTTAVGVQGIGQQGVGVRAVGMSSAPALSAEGQGSATAIKATYTGNLVGTAPAIDASTVGLGPAVAAVSAKGIGATFKGKVAAIRLVPQTKAGAPTTGHHLVGELIVDSAGAPWLCTVTGTPGTWRQLAFV